MENQELASKLVEREVYCCVSSLVIGLAQIAHEVSYKRFQDAFGFDQDKLRDLCQRPNYEEAARSFVMDDADLDQLEEVADENGYWGDVLDACVPCVHKVDPVFWCYTGRETTFDDEDEAREAAIESVLPEIRKQVWAITTNYEEVCSKYDLDYDYDEVYEHWVVSDWLARKLGERGEITGDVAGLTVWGRCCTGQSISMDSVVQDIAKGSY